MAERHAALLKQSFANTKKPLIESGAFSIKKPV